jgi:predicted MFS family arabinose efflux permease
MLKPQGTPWKLGLIPQAIANGLSSILVLLFLLSVLKGGLLDVGLVAGLSALALIPSQMLWGRLIDSSGRCKPFLVLGFVGMGLSLAAMPLVGSVSLLLVLVCLKSFLYAATLPARQLLTVESEHREGWRLGLANMQFLTSLGETIGMGIGALAAASLGYGDLFLLCGVLCVSSAAALSVLAREPGLMIQRKLVALERTTSTIIAVSDFVASPRRLTEDFAGAVMKRLDHSTSFLMIGILGFTLAGSALFSPLPAYFLQFFSSSSVFLLFFGGSLTGTICYLLVGRLAQSAGKSLAIAASMRMIVIPLLFFSALGATPGLVVGVLVLSLLEAFWSLFDVSSMFAFLETARVGRAGFYGALVGLGTAAGGFLGGAISMQYGFGTLFLLCSIVCGCALVAFVLQFRGRA